MKKIIAVSFFLIILIACKKESDEDTTNTGGDIETTLISGQLFATSGAPLAGAVVTINTNTLAPSKISKSVNSSVNNSTDNLLRAAGVYTDKTDSNGYYSLEIPKSEITPAAGQTVKIPLQVTLDGNELGTITITIDENSKVTGDIVYDTDALANFVATAITIFEQSPNAELTELEGRWITNCYNADPSSGSPNYRQDEWTFNQNNFTWKEAHYTNFTCQIYNTSSIENHTETGTFTIGASTTTSDTSTAVKKVDWLYDIVEYGTGYDIYELSGTTLILGDDSGLKDSNDNDRPTTLSTLEVLTKQFVIKETDTAATSTNFVGTWSGPFTIDSDSGTSIGTANLVITDAGGTLTGTFTLAGETYYQTLTGTVTNGQWNFSTATNDPSPDCDGWNVSGSSVLNNDFTIMNFSELGTFCGMDANLKGALNKQ